VESLAPLTKSRRGGSAWRFVEEAARTAEASARTREASGSAAVATTGATAAPAEPSRKRKLGFSTLR
jgi:hypothetical protein